MKRNSILVAVFLILSSNFIFSHDVGHSGPGNRTWRIAGERGIVSASFLTYKNGIVSLETTNREIVRHPLSALSESDRAYVLQTHGRIQKVNVQGVASGHTNKLPLWIGTGVAVAFALPLLRFFGGQLRRFAGSSIFMPILSCFVLSFAALHLTLTACNNSSSKGGESDLLLLGALALSAPATSTGSLTVPANDPAVMTTHFSHFSNVSTTYDETYFYVSSDGMATHEMMTGVISWQQQVPIPQPYTGGNAWSIPLTPALADSPLSTSENLLKGALAIAVNGIPIFNPLNNRGEDAKAVGELDTWGGHSGRADDYHYHVPPHIWKAPSEQESP